MIKMLTRSLSVLLVLVNLLSFIPTVAISSAEVDTSTGSTNNEYGGVSGTAGKGDSVTLNFAGGYRVYLTQSYLVSDNLDTDGALHFEDGEFTHKSTGHLNRYKN